jgi:hypothetical protein
LVDAIDILDGRDDLSTPPSVELAAVGVEKASAVVAVDGVRGDGAVLVGCKGRCILPTLINSDLI